MFDRFTDRARKVIGLARQYAHKYNCEYIGGEHILIALAEEGSGVAANALRALNIGVDKLEASYRELYPQGPAQVTMGQLPFTPVAKKVLEYAVEEASNLGHNYIGTEHVALGISRIDGSYGAIKVLEKVGLTANALRTEVLELLGADMDDKASEPKTVDPVVTLIKRRLDVLSTPSEIERKYGAGYSGPRLAVVEELQTLLREIERLKA